MSHEKRDPAKNPVPPLFEPAYSDMEDYDPMNSAGPAGNSTLTENNEKGILESALARTIAYNTTSELNGSDHHANRRGVYGSK